MRKAFIDLGTNTVLLLVADIKPDGVTAIFQDIAFARIGEGLSRTGLISETAALRAIEALEAFSAKALKLGAADITIVATEALRRASNSAEVLKLAASKGFNIRVIPQKEEAALSYFSNLVDFSRKNIVVDIGGGSTEVMWLDEGSDTSTFENVLDGIRTHLIADGCVTLSERYIDLFPVSEKCEKELTAHIAKLTSGLKEALPSNMPLMAIAGTPTTLAAMDMELDTYRHENIHGHILTRSALEKLIDKMRPLSLEELKKLKGLEPKRADVIYPGALILKKMMEIVGAESLTVSDHGVRWGMAYRDRTKGTGV